MEYGLGAPGTSGWPSSRFGWQLPTRPWTDPKVSRGTGAGVQGQTAEGRGVRCPGTDGRSSWRWQDWGGALTPSSRASQGPSLRPKALVLPGQPPPGLCPGRALVAGPPSPSLGGGGASLLAWDRVGEREAPKNQVGRRRCIAVQGGGDPSSQLCMQKGSKKRSKIRSPRSRSRIHLLCCPQPGPRSPTAPPNARGKNSASFILPTATNHHVPFAVPLRG